MRIDLRAKVLPENCRVWRMFPGHQYRLMEDFLSSDSAFFDLPNLPVIENIESDKNLHFKIYASLKMSELNRENSNSFSRVDWREYKNIKIDTTLGRIHSAVINFFTEASEGDLIVVPDHKRKGTSYIGVFQSHPQDRLTISDVKDYGKHRFVGREIKWFPAFNEALFSPALSSSLRHEHAFGDIGPEFYNEVFSLAYGNFIGNGVYSSTVSNGNKNFTDSDNTLVGVLFTLSAYACQAHDDGEKTFEIDDIFDFLFNRPPIEYACLFSSEHHSPGFTRFVSTKATAIVAVGAIAALLAMAEKAKAEGKPIVIEKIEFVNTLNSNGGVCDPEVDAAQEIMFKSIKGDKLRKACKNMLEVKERAKLGVRSRPTRESSIRLKR